MKRKIAVFLALLTLLIGLVLTPSSVFAAPPRQTGEGWTELVPGVDYQEFNLPGPVRAYVARMLIADSTPDWNDDDVILESAVAQGKLGSVETVRGMASRYNDSINFWDTQSPSEWGNRSEIIVAVNGSYFGGSDTPENGMVQSGWYAKRFDDNKGGSGLVWNLNRQVFIGDCVSHIKDKQILTIGETGKGFEFTGINVARGDDAIAIILYTPQFGLRTPAQSNGLEVVVKLSRPLLILPISANAVVGAVSQIYDSSGSTLIPFDSVVVSVDKGQRDAFLDDLSIGDSVRFNQEITGLSKECNATTVSFPWTKAYASIGAALHLVNDSAIYPPIEDATRAPRTAIAYDATHIYLIVVDGRQPDFSIGMTFQELGDFIVNTLNATNAVAQDGGGSSTMVVQGSVVNQPSDGCYMVFLPLVASPGGKVITAPSIPLDERFEPTDRLQHGCERRVANAMMIARVAPKESSATNFADGDVFTTMAAPLRVGPGTNYPGITVIPAGSYGKILSDELVLNGVRAKGTYWWKVEFNGQTGWIAEGAIAALTPRYSTLQNQH